MSLAQRLLIFAAANKPTMRRSGKQVPLHTEFRGGFKAGDRVWIPWLEGGINAIVIPSKNKSYLRIKTADGNTRVIDPTGVELASKKPGGK
jgi:hypothetical protein